MGYAPGWQIRCRKCGLTVEAGRGGGLIRLGGLGRSYTLGRCSACDRLRILVIEKRSDPNASVLPPTGYAPGWLVRCETCTGHVDAEAAGLIVAAQQIPMRVVGTCSRCRVRTKLRLERVESLPAR